MRTIADSWHAAGRAARDPTSRRLALEGLLFAACFLLLGAFLARLPRVDVAGLARPLAYVVDPLVSAWREDRDAALLGYVLLQAVLQTLHWGWYGGSLHRLAAVRLTTGRGESRGQALLFGLRHARGFAGARLTLLAGVLLPLAGIALLALTGRLPGGLGSALLVGAVLLAIPLALVAVRVLGVAVVAGFLTGPTIACEDSDAFDALSRTFAYAGAGLPRLVGLRLRFAFGVLLGTAWRGLGLLLLGGFAFGALRVGSGAGGALDRALAVLGASGRPADAERLGIGFLDHVLAGALAVAAAFLVLAWLADLVSRVVAARSAVYLILRREIDGVPLDRLATPDQAPRHRDARAAGFVEVARVGDE